MYQRPNISKVYEGKVKPFKIVDDVYFVGTFQESAHLIDTGDGLILLDVGDMPTLYLVIESIWELGFNPHDIKYILNTHWHDDHTGSTAAMADLSGAKTFIGHKELPHLEREGYFIPDVLLYDGDEIKLGNKTIKCIETPGHTQGTMSYFFDTVSGGKTYHVGMFGGAGANTLVSTVPTAYPNCRQEYLDSIERLLKIHVDVFIGNHCWNNNTLEKAKILAEGKENPFIDNNEEWTRFLNFCKKRCMELPEFKWEG